MRGGHTQRLPLCERMAREHAKIGTKGKKQVRKKTKNRSLDCGAEFHIKNILYMKKNEESILSVLF